MHVSHVYPVITLTSVFLLVPLYWDEVELLLWCPVSNPLLLSGVVFLYSPPHSTAVVSPHSRDVSLLQSSAQLTSSGFLLTFPVSCPACHTLPWDQQRTFVLLWYKYIIITSGLKGRSSSSLRSKSLGRYCLLFPPPLFFHWCLQLSPSSSVLVLFSHFTLSCHTVLLSLSQNM